MHMWNQKKSQGPLQERKKAKASRGFKTIVAISTFMLWQQMFLENPKKCTEPNLILLLGQLPHTREHCIITFSFGCLQAFDHNVPQHRKSATRSPSCCYGWCAIVDFCWKWWNLHVKYSCSTTTMDDGCCTLRDWLWMRTLCVSEIIHPSSMSYVFRKKRMNCSMQ